MQYWNEDVLDFLDKSVLKKWLPKYPTAATLASHGESLFRWYVIEVGFVSVIELVLAAFGHPSDPHFSATLGRTAFTALLAVGAQGFWDVGNARWKNRALAEAATTRLQDSIRLRSGVLSLAVSALSVTMAVSRILELDAAYWIAGGLAVSGGTYLAKVLLPTKSCRNKFQAEPLATPDKPAATDLNAPIP
jgi:hypothetical protein